jgi:hypothetical protein
VEKFFSELILEIVNIWETYLNKFSGVDSCIEHIDHIIEKVERFANKRKGEEKVPFITNFYAFNIDREVEECRKQVEQSTQSSATPLCPDIEVGEQMLIMVSELLCNEASTRNYQPARLKVAPEERINISSPDSLDPSIKFVPIFPIRKQYCYLYSIDENTY